MRTAETSPTVAVMGAGAWGTTLAWLLAGDGCHVRLWARSSQHAEEIQRNRENARRLPGTPLPGNITATFDLREALEGARYILSVVPSEHLRETVRQAAGLVPAEAVLISATKGLELHSGKRMSTVLLEETGLPEDRVLVLSGPNLSGEIVQGMPAVSVIAGTDAETVAQCQALLSTPLFRIYGNYDILGVEVCGALKNVIAIGAGISDGLGYGANAKAALVTRAMVEIGRLGTGLGAQRSTFWGVAGVGDVLATCNSHLSRNWQVGYSLGQGKSIEQIMSVQQSVAEGIPTTAAAAELSLKLGIEAPIVAVLHQILFEGRKPSEAVIELMTRRWRAEPEDWQ